MEKLKIYMLIGFVTIMGFVSCEDSNDSIINSPDKPVELEQRLEYEDVDYSCELDTLVNKLYTVNQAVKGRLSMYQGDVQVTSKKFDFNLNLEANLAISPNVVYVSEEEKLSTVTMTSTNASESESETVTEGNDFARTKIRKNFEFIFNEGEVVNAQTVYEKLSHLDHEFEHASIKNILYSKSDSKINEEKSNADSTVYDINLYFLIDVSCASNEDVNTKHMVRVPMQRIYIHEEPIVAGIVIENVGYVGQFDTEDKRLYTVEQKVNGDLVAYKSNGEELSRTAFSHDLNLEAVCEVPDDVYIDNDLNLGTVSLKSSSFGADGGSTRTVDGFTIKKRTLTYSFGFNAGEKVSVSTLYESLSYGDEKLPYSSIEGVSYKTYEAKLNESKTNDEYIVYDITLYLI